MINKLLESKKTKKMLKATMFSLIASVLIIILVRIDIKTKEEQDIKVALNKEYRTNYPKTETVWATIEIPSVKIKAQVFRGEDDGLLNYGVLHHKESYFPTEGKTIVIAGNDTYFKDLSKIKINEKIKLNTIYGTYKYIVEKTEVNNKEKLGKELEIIDEEQLILYTTYPDTPGYKSERFVVYARPAGDNKWDL